jgi:hypothetical protein
MKLGFGLIKNDRELQESLDQLDYLLEKRPKSDQTKILAMIIEAIDKMSELMKEKP